MGYKLKHLKTITKHKFLVTKYCFKSGLYLQGLKHDLSKFGLVEFNASAKFFQGTRSPINAEKEKLGYSLAWQHHKGHNAHHWEYWVDWEKGKQYVVRIPENYAYELVCDYVGAGKAYDNGNWTQSMPEDYYLKARGTIFIHSETDILLRTVFKDITDYGLDYTCRKMKNKEYQYSESGKTTEFVL